MSNDAEPYIAAVADACQKAGLFVVDYWSDDIDPRDGGIDLVVVPDADPEDYGKSRTLGWNEEDGWFIGQPQGPHGDLAGILYLCDGPLPAPADVAEAPRRVMAGEISSDERYAMMRRPGYRSREDEDDFESQLAAYRDAAATGGE